MASPPPSAIPLVTAFLNPERSTVTEYRPRTSGGELYAPDALVTTTVFTLVSSLWIVTVAPGTALPCASVTTPLIVARSERCASAGQAAAHTKTTVVATRSRTWWDLAIATSRRGVNERSEGKAGPFPPGGGPRRERSRWAN